MNKPQNNHIQVFEYQSNQTFKTVNYNYQYSLSDGWTVYRDDECFLSLGHGYRLMDTLACGVCSTDLARHHLPFVLPQVIGHEVVANDEGYLAVVDINASHKTRGLASSCYYCNTGLATHCPDRLTLGIDRLPGGFSPVILAPCEGIYRLNEGFTTISASMVEPFAACLRAIEVTPPEAEADIAIIGPRKLGLLMIVALEMFRKQNDLDFTITAIARHPRLASLCVKAGADYFINIAEQSVPSHLYDVVFDTTGSEAGFVESLRLSRNIVHLKSTHGLPVTGVKCFSDMVVREISLISEQAFNAIPSNHQDILSIDSAKLMQQRKHGYNAARCSSIKEIDEIMSLKNDRGQFLLNPRSTLVLSNSAMNTSPDEGAALIDAVIGENIQIHTSRCGDFSRAISLMSSNLEFFNSISSQMVTHEYPLNKIKLAFETARNSDESIKVIINIKAALDKKPMGKGA